MDADKIKEEMNRFRILKEESFEKATSIIDELNKDGDTERSSILTGLIDQIRREEFTLEQILKNT